MNAKQNMNQDSKNKNIATEKDVSEADIQKAFEDASFDLCYQPQVTLQGTEKVIGAEAFIRLNHPQHGWIVPPLFLPLIRKMGLELKLTEFVIQKVANDWNDWHHRDHDLHLSINIDSAVVSHEDFPEMIKSILAKANMPHQNLTLEITHSEDAQINDAVTSNILQLRISGFQLSLDDFGGQSFSVDTLKELPIDEIKIHRDVVSNLQNDNNAKGTVRKALHVSNQLGLRVVAVGVENEHDAIWLANLGCDAAQGYYYGKPIPSADFLNQALVNFEVSDSSSTKNRAALLLIEDDPQYAILLAEALVDLYDVTLAKTCAEAKAALEKSTPSLLVSDVNLPDGSGIDLLTSWKESNPSEETNLIFFSGQESTQDRLDAYAAGAIDFIRKPFSVAELIAKLGRVENFHKRHSQLSGDMQEIQSAAMQSMKEAAHYGDVVQFFKNLISCHDERSIANQLFKFMDNKSLSCSIQFRSVESTSSFDHGGTVCSPIEMNVFEILHKKGRLFDFGKRMIVNDRHVSVLIKNAPDNGEERGRIRDYIAVIIEGLETRYQDVIRQRLIRTVLQQLTKLASDISVAVDQHQEKSKHDIESLSLDLSTSFHVLDLTEGQETHLKQIIDAILHAQEDGEVDIHEMTKRLKDIIVVLSRALDDISPSSEDDNAFEQGAENGESSSSGIDLF